MIVVDINDYFLTEHSCAG